MELNVEPLHADFPSSNGHYKFCPRYGLPIRGSTEELEDARPRIVRLYHLRLRLPPLFVDVIKRAKL